MSAPDQFVTGYLAALRDIGEWFRLTPDIQEWLGELLTRRPEAPAS
jgi:hypothetical protein